MHVFGRLSWNLRLPRTTATIGHVVFFLHPFLLRHLQKQPVITNVAHTCGRRDLEVSLSIEEEWRAVKDSNERYEVSSAGRVRNTRRQTIRTPNMNSSARLRGFLAKYKGNNDELTKAIKSRLGQR